MERSHHRQCLPRLSAQHSQDLRPPDEQRIIDEVYPQCENISVDYAIMEKAEEIFVCPSDFGWSDLGTWGSLLLQTPKDIYGNAVIGQNVQLYDSPPAPATTASSIRSKRSAW